MPINFLGYKLYPAFLVEGNELVAYSLHYSKEKAVEHLGRIKRFHKLGGKVALDAEWENWLKEKLEGFPRIEFQLPNYVKYKYRSVYERLLKVKAGETVTYGQLMKELKLSRFQLINALKYNPFIILVPCHRVIGKSGLGNYTPLGIEFKKRLLCFEGALSEC